MAELPARSPALQTMYEQREALKAVASAAQRLSRIFGESGSLKGLQDYQAALEREAETRRAYSAAWKARQPAEPEASGTRGSKR